MAAREGKGKGKGKSAASSTQALLRQQLLGLSAHPKPKNSWQKTDTGKGNAARRTAAPVTKEGVPLTKAEILRRDEAQQRARTAQRNAAYLSAGKSERAAERESITRLIATQKRIHARTTHKQGGAGAVKIGERKLGPGFLERYGDGSAAKS